jgi:hypothetical protein
MSREKKFIITNSLLYLFVVVMLFILQISKVPWFFLWLILMHGGIVGLIVSKKKYHDLNILPYYRLAYLSFGLFIPILIYKVIAFIFSIPENKEAIRQVSNVIVIVCLFVAIYNYIKFTANNY